MTRAFPLFRLIQDGDLADILPFQSLRNVKELDLQHPFDFWDEYHALPDWPMNWSQLTALTSLSCMLSYDEIVYPPPVLNRMISLERLKIIHRYPELDDEHVDEIYGGDYELAQQPGLRQIFRGTQGLTKLSSLLIDGDQCIRRRSDFV